MTINASGLEFKELNERIRNTEEDVEIKECMGQRFIASGLSGKHIKISGRPRECARRVSQRRGDFGFCQRTGRGRRYDE